jgi:hypothetical protein
MGAGELAAILMVVWILLTTKEPFKLLFLLFCVFIFLKMLAAEDPRHLRRMEAARAHVVWTQMRAMEEVSLGGGRKYWLNVVAWSILTSMKARAWSEQNDNGLGELNENDEEQQRHRQQYEERPQFEEQQFEEPQFEHQLYDELHNDNEAIVGGERYALRVKAAAGRKDKGEEEINRDDGEQQSYKQQHEEQLYDELQNDNEVIVGGERYALRLVQKG